MAKMDFLFVQEITKFDNLASSQMHISVRYVCDNFMNIFLVKFFGISMGFGCNIFIIFLIHDFFNMNFK